MNENAFVFIFESFDISQYWYWMSSYILNDIHFLNNKIIPWYHWALIYRSSYYSIIWRFSFVACVIYCVISFQNVLPYRRVPRSDTEFRCRRRLLDCIGKTSTATAWCRPRWTRRGVTQKTLQTKEEINLRHTNNNNNSNNSSNNSKLFLHKCTPIGGITDRHTQKIVMSRFLKQKTKNKNFLNGIVFSA